MPTNRKNLHIVYLAFSISDISGGTRVISEHVNNLAKRGHNIEIWKTDPEDTPYFDTTVPVKTFTNEQLNEPDVVVMTDPGFIPSVSNHRSKSSTYLLVQHDNEWVSEVTGSSTSAKLIREQRDYFASGKCKILVVSSWLSDVIKEKYDLTSDVIQNGIDHKLFHPTDPVLKSKNSKIVLLIYDPQIWKGFNEAISAVLEVQKKLPNIKIAIMGRYFPETPKIQGMSFGFPFSALYFNRPKQTDLAEIYSSASVFVSASWLEGFGLPALEAISCGVPVVTTDSGGARDYAIPDITAVVVPPNNISALAEGISKLLIDDGLQDNLKRNGLKKSKEFNWNKSLDKLEKIFEKGILQA